MPKSNKAKPSASDVASRAAARNTDSAPAKVAAGNAPDAALLKASQTGDMVAGMPHNANKPLEYGYDNALNPPPGATVT
ncbi:MAG: hypothetical protein EOO26_07775, partial [Comamonadaceae bacterium]